MTTLTKSLKQVNVSEKLSPLHILLVEDNSLNAKLVSVLFAREGIGLTLARNGQEAIQKIKTATYDLVLMDMEMPVMNGYQATCIIRHVLHNDIPIIAMTANHQADEIKKCMQLGMNDYVTKPIEAATLFKTMYSLVKINLPVLTTPVMAKTPEQTGIAEKVCNMDYLLGITRGNNEAMQHIVTLFFKETGNELYMLKDAIAKTNYTVINDITHKIRSAFAILGIAVLEPVFNEMEYLSSHTSGIAKIEKLNGKVNTIFKMARLEMKAAD